MPPAISTLDSLKQSDSLRSLRLSLLDHPLYHAVQTADSLRIFMREHVFAVWDFMSLLKRLQQIVTCTDVPWMPSADASLARFVNEIVLGEECDEDGMGGYASHFELYLSAMDEVQADTKPIREFIANLRNGVSVETALQNAQILPSTRQFVQSTLSLTNDGAPYEVAAAFFHGREDVIPDMFARLVKSLPQQGVAVGRLVHYLNRHIELDSQDHGPLASRLVKRLCAGEESRVQQADSAAAESIRQRIGLWDGILAEVRQTA